MKYLVRNRKTAKTSIMEIDASSKKSAQTKIKTSKLLIVKKLT